MFNPSAKGLKVSETSEEVLYVTFYNVMVRDTEDSTKGFLSP